MAEAEVVSYFLAHHAGAILLLLGRLASLELGLRHTGGASAVQPQVRLPASPSLLKPRAVTRKGRDVFPWVSIHALTIVSLRLQPLATSASVVTAAPTSVQRPPTPSPSPQPILSPGATGPEPVIPAPYVVQPYEGLSSAALERIELKALVIVRTSFLDSTTCIIYSSSFQKSTILLCGFFGGDVQFFSAIGEHPEVVASLFAIDATPLLATIATPGAGLSIADTTTAGHKHTRSIANSALDSATMTTGTTAATPPQLQPHPSSRTCGFVPYLLQLMRAAQEGTTVVALSPPEHNHERMRASTSAAGDTRRTDAALGANGEVKAEAADDEEARAAGAADMPLLGDLLRYVACIAFTVSLHLLRLWFRLVTAFLAHLRFAHAFVADGGVDALLALPRAPYLQVG